jgi:hypothetical protein
MLGFKQPAQLELLGVVAPAGISCLLPPGGRRAEIERSDASIARPFLVGLGA